MKKLLTLSYISFVYLCISLNTAYSLESKHSILADMNMYRERYNLQPIKQNEVLCALAHKRVEQIQTDWSHGQFQQEIDAITGMSGVFHENLARTFLPEEVVWAWSMSQAGHREAMLIPTMKYGCVAQLGDYYAFEGYEEK